MQSLIASATNATGLTVGCDLSSSRRPARKVLERAADSKSVVRGYVPPEEWDSGIDAGFLGYGINLSSNRFGNRTERQFFSSANAGLNLGDWRFRHNGSFSYTDRPGALQRSPSQTEFIRAQIAPEVRGPLPCDDGGMPTRAPDLPASTSALR